MKRNKIGGTRRPLRTEAWQGRDDSRSRGGNATTTHHTAEQPSAQFDWDAAIYLHAVNMAELGYPLSAMQKRLLKDG
jgi:hypothetical protein